MKLPSILKAVGAAAAIMLCSQAAQSITIVSYVQSGPGNPFAYDQGLTVLPPGVFDGSYTAGTAAAPIAVTFDFLNGTGGVLAGDPFAATLELSGFAESVAIMSAGSGSQDTRIPTYIFRYAGPPMGGVSPGDPIFVATAGIFPGDIGGTLNGSGTSVGIIGSEPGNPITFTSSVDPNIALATNKSYSISLTALSTTLALSTGDGNDFATTNAGISGVFGAEQVVPEPGSFALAAGLFGAAGIFTLRRRRRAAS